MQLLIHPHELSERWVHLAQELKLDRLSFHPVGGKFAHESLQEMLQRMEDRDFCALQDRLLNAGIEIGYEFHAMSHLLPRDLFSSHPEYFRMDAEGNRVEKGNYCFSNSNAEEIICRNAASLAKKLRGNCKEYYFWMDDATRLLCHCPSCREHNFAHHQLNLMNRIAETIRREEPEAKVCYLAYYEGVAVPDGNLTPHEGVFLEYAPFERYTKPETLSFEGEYLERVRNLIRLLGSKNSKVLEYWYDNSIYYRRAGNQLVPFTPNNERIRSDLKFYRELGFEAFTSFACSLCDEYVSLFGNPDFSAIAPKSLQNI